VKEGIYMSGKSDDQFLQPLKNRPGLNGSKAYKEELKNKLFHEKMKEKRPFREWLPNVVTILLALIGGYFAIGFLLSDDDRSLSNQGLQEPTETSETVPEDKAIPRTGLNEELAAQLLGRAFAHYSAVVNGGGTEMSDTFIYKGEPYRYLEADFDTQAKVMEYLMETFTKEVAEEIMDIHSFEEIEGKLAQPDEDFSERYIWEDAAAIKILNPNGNTYVTFEVPVESGEKDTEIFEISLSYAEGWKINGLMPFSPSSNEEKTEDSTHRDFSLTDKETAVYQVFSEDPTEVHLKDMSPVSIAKIYVQALIDNRKDLVYELYTDRLNYIRWTKEEQESFPPDKKETILKTYKGIEKGEFIQKDDIHGFISFDNGGEGKMGFQMVKDEDGYWSVGFMPVQ
jgi:hypothetical protein